ncbi:BA14K family protein [Bradyrhizobium tropiciagri]|uniref:BA14K family protein n=1 Tax=Bradyrhizobium tropiciagri TaxID=312253 RepID=UPI001BA5C3B1|nr:BA14K family protein [Bradyrhizobium tropiciagri]MBR0870203.1 BA14K family protein [Bradyrhizobium tropiciagri]
MKRFNVLIAAALLTMTATTAAHAQLPAWAADHPAAFDAQYPDRSVLNDGALTPAGRMGLELPGGAAPVFGAQSVYAADHATSSQCARLYRSYDPASRTYLSHDGRRIPVSDARAEALPSRAPNICSRGVESS